jgi:predicted AlkP superfamily pyrophosphatase or phosphodiesterase
MRREPRQPSTVRGFASSRTVALIVLFVIVASCSFLDDNDARERSGAGGRRSSSTRHLIERACALEEELLLRIWRGHDDESSEDITTVPLEPNYAGSFNVTSHSGPWDYLQRVPLVLYGPGIIKAQGKPLERPASIVDVYPTAGMLSNVSLPPRDGQVLDEAVDAGFSESPKLILTIMWDGVGRNVLERWPEAWPTLKRMERKGTSYQNAVVGSSPSITPATHSSLGTGAYPRKHGVTAIEYRDQAGKVSTAFAMRDPGGLDLTTFADEIDRELGNRPLAGLIGWRSWHQGMLGHGSMTPGGDNDHLGLIGFSQELVGNDRYYSTPAYLQDFDGLEERISQLDRTDGELDGEWMGDPIAERHDNPAWVNYQTDVVISLMDQEGYGADDVPDMLFTNFKMTDIVGHQYTMDSPRMKSVLHAQDDALARILEYLEDEVQDYVVVLSADHGHTPSPERTAAWPILQGQLGADLGKHFGIPEKDLVQQTTAAGPFIDKEVMTKNGVTLEDIARFLNGYTIGDNWGRDQLPSGYSDRADEPVFEAVWPSDSIDEIMRCARRREVP